MEERDNSACLPNETQKQTQDTDMTAACKRELQNLKK